MQKLARLIRIEPAFDDPDLVRALFERHAPYRTIAEYIPRKPDQAAFPYFRGNWAVGGQPLVEGAETILQNHRFIAAARALFDSPRIRPTFIVVNLNAPMPAGPIHVDVPTFRGATREQYPLGWLIAMGRSELFERWRIIQAGAVSWFYNGPGGNFEYWPQGRDGPMLREQPPFRNVAIMADNDRMYHRIGRVGTPNAALPQMTAAAELHAVGGDTWAIVENGEVRATYPFNAVRLSLVWKADLEPEDTSEPLDLDRVMTIFIADLGQRKADFRIPGDPLSDKTWIATLDCVYGTGPDAPDPQGPT
ncbi:MAG: hypothetical protein JO121_28595 [Deltaproteobacteria bacterium]|jgi:hypothetical protein|nr:hypothetical protein [Deltaproteobacteria bacterium]